MPLNCNVEITRDFFLELNAKHVHGGKNENITNCISKSLGACTCLPNTYTSRTHLVHVFCVFIRKNSICCLFRKFKGRDDPCTCCVHVRQTRTRS